MDKSNRPSKNMSFGAEAWLDEHGHPDFDYLAQLVEDDAEEGTKTLESIADDLDVEYDAHTPSKELLEKIRLAIQQNDD